MDENTLKYYDQNAAAFAAGTASVDFRAIAERFLSMLPEGADILDLGCGSGRDTAYFLFRGCRVDAVDGSEEMCRLASRHTGIPVRRMLFQELDAREAYDGVWACASLLHLSRAELPPVLKRISAALRRDGVLYASFKYGDFEGERNGRYFTDLTPETFAELARGADRLVTEEVWITGDVRPGREQEQWLNLLLRKRGEK